MRGQVVLAAIHRLHLEGRELGGGAFGRGLLDRCGRARCRCLRRRLAAGRGRFLRRLAGGKGQRQGQREQQQRGLAGHGVAPESV
ncbi:hypothetical protein G6F58_013794 [Rhizopus delemar]|nr:hypothetical protein G6F58_013794 [Rhizopus delemar]